MAENIIKTGGVDPWDYFSQPTPTPSEKSDPWEMAKQGVSTTAEGTPAEGEESKYKPGTFWSSRTGRFLQGAAEPIVGTAQLASHVTGIGSETMDNAAKELHAFYQASRGEAGLGKEDWDLWAGAGNIASPINYIPGGVAGRVARAGTTVGRSIATGIGTGAAYGAMQPVSDAKDSEDYWNQKGGQAVSGAITGGVLAPASHIAGELLAPQISKEGRELAAKGVELTPGQLYGERSTAKWLEDFVERVPFVGNSIQIARGRGIESFNKVAAQEALDNIGVRLPKDVKAGHELVRYTEDAISAEYNRLHPQISMTGVTPQLTHDLSIVKNAASGATPGIAPLPPQQMTSLEKIIDEQILGKLQAKNGTLDGKTIQTITSNLGRTMKQFSKDPNADNKTLGHLIGDVRNAFQGELLRQNPALAPELQKANAAWSYYVRMRGASANKATQAHDGVFTPTQLGTAISKEAASPRVLARAEPTSIYQDIVEAGRKVMPSQIPNSGTPERLAGMHAAGALAAGQFPVLIPPLLASGTTSAIYSRPVQDLIRNLLTRNVGPIQQGIAKTFRQYGALPTGNIIGSNQ